MVQVVKAIDHALKLDKCTSTTTRHLLVLRCAHSASSSGDTQAWRAVGVGAEDVASSIKALCEASAYDGDVKFAARAQALVILLSQELEAGGRSGGYTFPMRLLSDPQRALHRSSGEQCWPWPSRSSSSPARRLRIRARASRPAHRHLVVVAGNGRRRA